MKLKTLLTISAIYLGVLGVGFMLAPRQLGIDAVPADASPALVAYLRIFGGPMVGIGVLNWLARNAEPSTARDAIVLANLVGFACVTSIDIVGGIQRSRASRNEAVSVDSPADDGRFRHSLAGYQAGPTT